MVNKVLELYSRCGISLLNKGVIDAALPLSVTDEVLTLFFEAEWVVLGGDVYQCENDEMKNFHADWYCGFSTSYESCEHAKLHLSRLKGENIYVSFSIKS